ADLISYDDALRNADSVNDVRLRIKLEGKDSKSRELGESMRNVTFK
ncbi:MAG: type IV pili twitching motility protein PilT, partial [Sulfuricaulis sp.]